MGGHAAGEVASAATITTIAPLDAEDPGPDLVNALADAVATANLRLQELIISDPAIEGMGTTLTALLWVEGYAALCHIGDSRAYLLRDGQFVQITHDHTLVQSLVDEGKITEDDVATHPHRSLLLRALDGRTIAEPDLTPLETYPGDRYMICSDGLSGVVTEQTLHQTLASIEEPEKAALRLIELAIKGGGPDNITCIVADVIDSRSSRVPPTWQPVFAGAAANGAPAELRPPRQSSPATRAMRLSRTAPQPTVPNEPPTGVWQTAPMAQGPSGYHDGYTGAFDTSSFEFENTDTQDRTRDTAAFDRPDGFPGRDNGWYGQEDERGRRGGGHRRKTRNDGEDDDYRSRKRRWPIVTGSLVLLVVLVAAGGYGFWRYNKSQYYVGIDTKTGVVAIFQGTNQSLAGINLSSLYSDSKLKASQLTPNDQAQLTQTISRSNVQDAQQKINQLAGEAKQCQQTYTELKNWQLANTNYQKYLTAKQQATVHKTKAPAVVQPAGPMPTQLPNQDQCAPPAQFGIAPTALPTPGETAATAPPAAKPTKTPTAHPTTTPAAG